MPDKLADHRCRISMAEDVEIVEAMRKLAAEQGKTLTDIYAEAARLFLQKKGKQTKK